MMSGVSAFDLYQGREPVICSRIPASLILNLNLETMMEIALEFAAIGRDYEAPVVVREFDETWQPAAGRHAHREGQMLVLTRGMAILEVEQGCWLIPAGRCVWVPPDSLHAGGCLGRYAGWEAKFSAQASAVLPKQVRVMDSSPLFKEILGRLLGAPQPSGLWSSKQQRLLAVLCDEILHSAEHRFHLPIPTDHRLARIFRALIDNIADQRPLEGWAKCAGMSKRTLTRTFRQETGMSFHQWKQHLRIFRALELLLKKEPVADVAMAVGYESASAFIAMFRSVLGAPPKLYLERTVEPYRMTEGLAQFAGNLTSRGELAG
jgi:AraC-like DNA-binding protein